MELDPVGYLPQRDKNARLGDGEFDSLTRALIVL
jgi:hypothetical protein